jgi:Rad3-related DNA helicase
MVILLDDRVTSTKWGKTFFSAFPKDINIKHGTSESLLKILKELS